MKKICHKCKSADAVRQDNLNDPYCQRCDEYLYWLPPTALELIVGFSALVVFSPVILFGFLLSAIYTAFTCLLVRLCPKENTDD